MANDIIAEPDLQFTKDLISAGAGDLKKCYQCATCSVACRIAPDNSPYPRKEMIWAQWGLKDRLLNDPDVWLCHQCNDCSTQCPRGANPGDVLKAVRKMNIQENSWPSFLGKLVGTPGMFVLAVGIPIAVVLFIVYISGWAFPSGPIKYSSHSIAHPDGFIYLPLLQVIFTAALVFGAVSLIMSLKSYWKQLESSNPVGISGSGTPFVPSLIESLQEILPHTTFKECEANNIRYAAHLLAFWGMMGLFVTTAIVAFNYDILGLKPPSQNGPGTVPIKILGNASAISFVLGLAIMLVRRLTTPDQTGTSAYFDWFFLFVIFGAGASGLLTELSRWTGLVGATYTLYTIHLMFVLGLLLYLPFSKFAHLGYRTVAIAWSKSVGRNKSLPVAPNYIPPVKAETAE
ncbi:MAG: quinone-interacting membrane-bound oxidoreductase complex subunit QmoC [Desulfomonile tiedjei]|uniref:Quinone-interacting membrane-bound oxidoreductase complex subunit QmoC n=1 Tax=Desulfomonile tiedjei TaxID=2358 RepID=A0A9D6VC18_9BACT|nr:quinone-interacting membrane-bound oxidoreductase complex subunit QmoC [Desulfomonile tiedjei]